VKTVLAVERAQRAVADSNIDAWLLYDYRGSNEYFADVTGSRASLTRRAYIFIPKHDRPRALIHYVDKPQFKRNRAVDIDYYVTWQEFYSHLKTLLSDVETLALEYSRMGELPTVSMVDGGFLEAVRSTGVNVVSSAPLFQTAFATWPAAAVDSHRRAVERTYDILQAALRFTADAVRKSAEINEFDVQQFIVDAFDAAGLETEDRPIVAVNRNSSDPHYEPSSALWSPIRADDWMLVDLWAKEIGEENVFADITWVAMLSETVPDEYERAFSAVREARDAVVSELEGWWAERGHRIEGWELDQIAQDVLEKHGYGAYVRHRTGHSMGPGRFLHARGVNLDNLETHDTRPITPGIGFSVEPGVYLEGFGVRSEIDVYIDPVAGPVVTTPRQVEIQRI
jgi:Xaa-Pro aminopeptidase